MNVLICEVKNSTYMKPYKRRRVNEGGLDRQYTPTEKTCSVFRQGKEQVFIQYKASNRAPLYCF